MSGLLAAVLASLGCNQVPTAPLTAEQIRIPLDGIEEELAKVEGLRVAPFEHYQPLLERLSRPAPG